MQCWHVPFTQTLILALLLSLVTDLAAGTTVRAVVKNNESTHSDQSLWWEINISVNCWELSLTLLQSNTKRFDFFKFHFEFEYLAFSSFFMLSYSHILCSIVLQWTQNKYLHHHSTCCIALCFLGYKTCLHFEGDGLVLLFSPWKSVMPAFQTRDGNNYACLDCSPEYKLLKKEKFFCCIQVAKLLYADNP